VTKFQLELRYIAGAFYSCCVYLKRHKERNQVIFRSKHKKLVELVRDEIFPGHSITSDNRKGKSSHWINAYSTPRLYSKLEELGLTVPKKEREFPENISENQLYNVVRGFFDAEAAKNVRKNYIRIGFCNRFLSGLNKVLIKHAGINGGTLKDNELIYKKDDAIKIYNFIYQNFDFIKRNGSYLREKKEAFYKFITKKPKINRINLKRHRKRTGRIEHAKKLLEKELETKEVAKKVGYAYPTRFCRAFKEVTGCTPTAYKKNIEEKREQKRIECWL